MVNYFSITNNQIFISKLTINTMKEIFRTIIDVYREDKKTFWEDIIGATLIFGFIIFTYWFVGTFCYDM
jgi:hypothetical protein